MIRGRIHFEIVKSKMMKSVIPKMLYTKQNVPNESKSDEKVYIGISAGNWKQHTFFH